MACVIVLLQGRTIEVQYVRTKHSAIQAFYNSHRRVLRVAHQWLDLAGSHGPVFCRETLSSKLGGQSFFCDHVMEELLKSYLVPLLGRSAAFKNTEVMTLRKIRRLLRHIPHTITVSRSFLAGALKITWEDTETESFRKRSMHGPPYHAVLHEEKCSSTRADLIYGDAGMWSLVPINRDNATDTKEIPVDYALDHTSCGYPQHFVSQKTMTPVFENLQSSKRYNPMVSLNSSQAIYGFPPRPKHPALPNSRIVHESNGRGDEQPPDLGMVTLNTPHQSGGFDHHKPGPFLTVKSHFSDESDSKRVDCKRLKMSRLVEGAALD
jgi:hypothetical protein